jgi:hypothetical protein
VILKNLEVSELIIKCIINKNLFKKIFKMNEPNENLSDAIIRLTQSNPNIKKELFKIVFDEIFSTLTLAEEQLNVSFVDIINIDSIYKIGYSGTVNMELPDFLRSDDIFKMSEIVADLDESVNVLYALANGKTFNINQLETSANVISQYIKQFKQSLNLENYDAFIDQVGIFKNLPNIEVAKYLSNYFKFSRDIIFMSETDQKYVLSKENIQLEYSSSKKYFKPFIYYSQGHVVGVDIRQDYLPKMKGLVTINPKSIYTNVAQAVFRLRKINMGHSVDILYISKDLNRLSSVDVCNIIKFNEEKQKADKSKLLTYQTLKSEIRKDLTITMINRASGFYNSLITKKQNNGEIIDEKEMLNDLNKYKITAFNEIYKEKIKYYFMEPFPSTNQEYLTNIVNIKTAKFSTTFNKLFKKIDDVNILKKLVFSIDSDCANVTISKSIEKEVEKEVIKIKEVSNTIFNELGFSKPLLKWDYIQYLFTNLKNPDIFERICFPINEVVSCVPNITVQFNGSEFVKNKSGQVWVLVPEVKKILLVPGYMGPIFASEYVLLSCKNLTLINYNMVNKYYESSKLIEEFKENDLIEFINLGDYVNSYELDKIINYITNNSDKSIIKTYFIIYIICENLTNKLAGHINVLSALEKIHKELFENFNKLLSQWASGNLQKQIIIPFVKKLTSETLEPFFKTDDEYKCDSNVKNFKEKLNQISLLNEQINKDNEKKQIASIQSANQKAINKCNKYKIEYQDYTTCKFNKWEYLNSENIQLCQKNKVEYENNQINSEIYKLTLEKNKIDKEIKKIDNKINIKKESITTLSVERSKIKETKQTDELKKLRKKISSEIDKDENKIKELNSEIMEKNNKKQQIERQITELKAKINATN